MSSVTHLPALYRGIINLWVEDTITREYLAECWSNDPSFLFLVGGGNESIQSAVKSAEEEGIANVFGFVDSDFGLTNRTDWFEPAKTFRRFVAGVHELENYLLDATALEGCGCNTGGRLARDIEARLRSKAAELVWWMACRQVIMDLRSQFRDNFLRHPPCPRVTDLPTAENWITAQPWYMQLGAHSAAALAPGRITSLLTAAHAVADAQLAGGAWKQTFSGKELFHYIRDWVYTVPADPDSTPSQLDVDLAKSVAQWQVANYVVPRDVIDLRLSLRQRVGV